MYRRNTPRKRPNSTTTTGFKSPMRTPISSNVPPQVPATGVVDDPLATPAPKRRRTTATGPHTPATMRGFRSPLSARPSSTSDSPSVPPPATPSRPLVIKRSSSLLSTTNVPPATPVRQPHGNSVPRTPAASTISARTPIGGSSRRTPMDPPLTGPLATALAARTRSILANAADLAHRTSAVHAYIAHRDSLETVPRRETYWRTAAARAAQAFVDEMRASGRLETVRRRLEDESQGCGQRSPWADEQASRKRPRPDEDVDEDEESPTLQNQQQKPSRELGDVELVFRAYNWPLDMLKYDREADSVLE
ncbi:hypothetical protein BC828DRAFT_387879 [Blastocladiella britannica]|nr:hypothetical protein BC828DRAFT_387879 [Blastocladiella britannica]